MDYSFMKTGLIVEDDIDIEFVQKVQATFSLLIEDALKTSANFVECCGRRIVTTKDIRLALQYEAREFFARSDLEERFPGALNEIQEEYERDSENDEESENNEEIDEESENEDETEENVSLTLIENPSYTQKVLYHKVINYDKNWADWKPEDPAQLLLYNAINKTPF